LYIRFMGIEAYGLVGFFATLQALFSLLDLGLSATMNREMARYSVQPDKAQEARDLVRTLEVGYWAMGIVIGIVVLVLSPFIAHDWVKAEKLAPAALQQAVVMMGLAIAFQWPTGFYAGGLMGLQRQVLLNVINTGVATLRGAGAILILWLLSPTIQAFFGWQVLTSVLQTLLTAFYFGGFDVGGRRSLARAARGGLKCKIRAAAASPPSRGNPKSKISRILSSSYRRGSLNWRHSWRPCREQRAVTPLARRSSPHHLLNPNGFTGIGIDAGTNACGAHYSRPA
jgi:hypothetical protein